MSNHKFTDDEIIKALEGLAAYDCKRCLDLGHDCFGKDCDKAVAEAALALINRQKAEIKSLEKVLHELKMEAEMVYKQRDAQKNRADSIAKFAKAEAIKEFAERLKPKLSYYDEVYVDALVKEMTEE